MEVYKIMRDINKVDRQNLHPTVGVCETRGLRFKMRWRMLRRTREVTAPCKYNRIRNELLEEVMEVGTVKTFKRHLERVE